MVAVPVMVTLPPIQMRVVSSGCVVNTGSCGSVTVTTNEQVSEELLILVVTNVLVVGPIGNMEPLGRPATWVVTAGIR